MKVKVYTTRMTQKMYYVRRFPNPIFTGYTFHIRFGYRMFGVVIRGGIRKKWTEHLVEVK